MSKITITSLVSPPASVAIDPYGLNPIAEDYKAVNATTYGIALRKAGPPPKLFTDGAADLPAFTASGFDPSMLLKLPFTCRHYAASIENRAQVARLFEELSTDPYGFLEHPGLRDAITRVRRWASGGMDRSPATADVGSM